MSSRRREEPPPTAQEGETPAAPTDGDTIGRNTVSALVIQLSSSVFTAAIVLFLVRALGPKEYGTFALAFGVGSLLFLPSDFGVSQSAARFIAERRGRPTEVADVLASAIKLKLLLTGAVAAALFAGAGLIAGAYHEPVLTWPLRAVAVALIGQSFMTLYQYSFIAVGRTIVGLRLVLAESMVEAATTVALVLLGVGVLGAATGRASGYVVGAVVATVTGVRLFGRRSVSPRRQPTGRMRSLAGYAGALLIVDGAFAAFNQIDVLLIGALLGTTSVGQFQPILRLVAFLHFPGNSVASGVAPRVARHEHHPPNIAAFRAALRGLIIFQASLVAPVIVWAEPITRLLLGPRYPASADVLRAIAPYIFLSGIAPLVSVTVNYLGEARRRVPIAIAALLINAAIDLLLLPRIGVVAGAIGTDAAYLLYVPAHFFFCKRLLGVSLRPIFVTLVRALAAAAAMGAVMLVVGTSSLSLVEWVLGITGGLAAFMTVLLVTRELSIGELRAAWGLVAVRFGRSRA